MEIDRSWNMLDKGCWFSCFQNKNHQIISTQASLLPYLCFPTWSCRRWKETRFKTYAGPQLMSTYFFPNWGISEQLHTKKQLQILYLYTKLGLQHSKLLQNASKYIWIFCFPIFTVHNQYQILKVSNHSVIWSSNS